MVPGRDKDNQGPHIRGIITRWLAGRFENSREAYGEEAFLDLFLAVARAHLFDHATHTDLTHIAHHTREGSREHGPRLERSANASPREDLEAVGILRAKRIEDFAPLPGEEDVHQPLLAVARMASTIC
jgi:hypothetical protein